METIVIDIIKYLVTVIAGIILGNGAVYLFNRAPGEWFLDYDEKMPGGSGGSAGAGDNGPGKDVDVFGACGPESLKDREPGAPQRVRSTPWKYLFSMVFIAAGLYLVRDDWVYTIAALIVCWILLELSIADIKYRIIPDQFLILLAVSAVGLIQYHQGWQDMLYGAALGFGIMGIAALLGKAMYRREAVGGGDIKLFTALGLVLGVHGVIAVFMLSALISGAHMVFLLAARKIKRKDTIPMVPYIAVSAGIYLLFIWQGPAAVYLDTLII